MGSAVHDAALAGHAGAAALQHAVAGLLRPWRRAQVCLRCASCQHLCPAWVPSLGLPLGDMSEIRFTAAQVCRP